MKKYRYLPKSCFLFLIVSMLFNIDTSAQSNPFTIDPSDINGNHQQTDDEMYYYDPNTYTPANPIQSTTGGSNNVKYIYTDCSNPPTIAYPDPPVVVCTTSTFNDPFVNIENTGNDNSSGFHFNSSQEEITFEATAWDGTIPAFSFIHKKNPEIYWSSDIESNFVVQLSGNYYGEIKDPDIIISKQNLPTTSSQMNPFLISILVVYEFIPDNSPNDRVIAYEQWVYDHSNLEMRALGFNPATNYLTTTSEIATNPNIDVNSDNEFIIVYETENLGQYDLYTTGGTFSDNITFNPINRTKLNIGKSGRNPDVTLENSFIISPQSKPEEIVPIVKVTPNVYISYNSYSSQSPSLLDVFVAPLPTLIGTTPNANPTSFYENICTSIDNPRINSSRSNRINQPSFAVTTIDSDNEVVLFIKPNNTPNNVSNLVDLDVTKGSVIEDCLNERPVVVYGNHNKISVAWSHTNCGNEGGNEVLALAVNYELLDNASPPNIHRSPSINKFMKVVSSGSGTQEHISLSYNHAYEAPLPTDHFQDNTIYYSLAAGSIEIQDGTPILVNQPGIIYKQSLPASQPYLRKKANSPVIPVDKIDIYPNPSTGLFMLNIESKKMMNYNIEMRDIKGKIVYTNSLRVDGSYNTDLNFIDFAKGLYFLQIKTPESIEVKKLIIQ